MIHGVIKHGDGTLQGDGIAWTQKVCMGAQERCYSRLFAAGDVNVEGSNKIVWCVSRDLLQKSINTSFGGIPVVTDCMKRVIESNGWRDFKD